MIQGRGSEQAPVARVPQVAVESGRRGVAGRTPVRRWSGTTRCNELAVIVMRDGELVGRESLIAAVRPWIPEPEPEQCGVTPQVIFATHSSAATTLTPKPIAPVLAFHLNSSVYTGSQVVALLRPAKPCRPVSIVLCELLNVAFSPQCHHHKKNALSFRC